ncbi:hypothetical protein [Ilyobacter polytropus]|uniref:Uncharacterized protein n=1 Tax=Ilyobacter polytropus (strain ATCC 51220 / DSM 2926 / LMG 16218 / CuHBu1) TaxID=572544 RepID=E3HBN7_ILYPC|nr:hypothetical protein [Ilyobacter polytropus]ADO83799.1 hypothetical protein Ilyop_2028 [Ilyobacter polytropus DSM 2926]
MKELTLSKLDIVKRQLETAIILYFNEKDPVSIHTLTCAAYNVIRDLNYKKENSSFSIREMFFKYGVKKEHEKEVIKKFNAAQNFFKHADKDSDEFLNFNPKATEILIFDAANLYSSLSGEKPELFLLFISWYIANNSDLFEFPLEHTEILNSNKEDILKLGRQGYFNKILPTLYKI